MRRPNEKPPPDRATPPDDDSQLHSRTPAEAAKGFARAVFEAAASTLKEGPAETPTGLSPIDEASRRIAETMEVHAKLLHRSVGVELQRPESVWDGAIDEMNALITACWGLRFLALKVSRPHTRRAVGELQERVTLRAGEVTALLKAGFFAAARARWRSAHEAAVIAYFIDRHGEAVAGRYLAHEVIRTHRFIRLHVTHGPVWEMAPIPRPVVEGIQRQRADLLSLYGKDFDRDYGWAAAALAAEGRAASFAAIEASVGAERWRLQYSEASQMVHGSGRDILVEPPAGSTPHSRQGTSPFLGTVASWVGLSVVGATEALLRSGLTPEGLDATEHDGQHEAAHLMAVVLTGALESLRQRADNSLVEVERRLLSASHLSD